MLEHTFTINLRQADSTKRRSSEENYFIAARHGEAIVRTYGLLPFRALRLSSPNGATNKATVAMHQFVAGPDATVLGAPLRHRQTDGTDAGMLQRPTPMLRV